MKQLEADEIVRPAQVARLIGASRISLFRWEKQGLFPPRHRIGVKAVGWPLSEVLHWMHTRPALGPSGTATKKKEGRKGS